MSSAFVRCFRFSWVTIRPVFDRRRSGGADSSLVYRFEQVLIDDFVDDRARLIGAWIEEERIIRTGRSAELLGEPLGSAGCSCSRVAQPASSTCSVSSCCPCAPHAGPRKPRGQTFRGLACSTLSVRPSNSQQATPSTQAPPRGDPAQAVPPRSPQAPRRRRDRRKCRLSNGGGAA